jgi:hypothetical protein
MVIAIVTAGMIVSLFVGDAVRRRLGGLLEEMVHPMRHRGDQKNPKGDGHAQICAAFDFRSGYH